VAWPRLARPAIGITADFSRQDRELFSLRDDYVRAVEDAGGLPLVLAPGRPRDVPEILDRVGGLLLTGGGDIDPDVYGEPPHEKLGRVIRERDAFELALCREALSRKLPVFAICRGHQVLNVATGGTLVQDIPSQMSGAMDHDPDTARWELAHQVRILPGTRLRAILGADRVAVNSFHHQAVRETGPGVVVSARADDEVIEGIEVPGPGFAVGVQWHPEAFWDHGRRFQPLFAALVEASGDRSR
jgi:putative glutamine amidotransferase